MALNASLSGLDDRLICQGRIKAWSVRADTSHHKKAQEKDPTGKGGNRLRVIR
ncbi:MAG: hypothetical protein PVG37_07885 [Desulfobacterales bacterium]